MTEFFIQGAQVQTHSLTTVQYNYRTGIITGSPFDKNGTIRVPVNLQLDDGSMKSMLLQPKNLTLVQEFSTEGLSTITSTLDLSSNKKVMKECRCMFCGDSLVLESEEEAIAHMAVCPSLQEQLNDTEHQFTLPASMK